MYPNPKRAKKLYSEIVPKTVDEYLSFLEKYKNQEEKRENTKSPYGMFHNGKSTKRKDSCDAFFNASKFSWI